MASNSTPNRERVDSAIDGNDPVPKTLITAQNLCTAVSLFASDTAVQDFTELLELFSQREKDLEAREGTIRDLEKDLAAQTKSHEVFDKQQAAAFANARYDLMDESYRWESEAEGWKEKSEAKDAEIVALQRKLEVSMESNADLEGALSQSTNRSKEKEQEIGKLEARLERALTVTDSHKQALIKSEGQMAELKRLLEGATKKTQELQGNVDTLSENYGKVKKFSAKMKQLDLTATYVVLPIMLQSKIIT
jgi:chromosome segregation ATPase